MSNVFEGNGVHRFRESLVDRNVRERNGKQRFQRRVAAASVRIHHLRATFTYEASRTRGNDRAVQLPDVTCILHPSRHDDPFSLCPPTRRYDDGPPTSMNFHSRPATPISSLSIDPHILFSIDGQICIARVIHLLCYSHDFIVNSSRMKGSWCPVNDYAIDDLCLILFLLFVYYKC